MIGDFQRSVCDERAELRRERVVSAGGRDIITAAMPHDHDAPGQAVPGDPPHFIRIGEPAGQRAEHDAGAADGLPTSIKADDPDAVVAGLLPEGVCHVFGDSGRRVRRAVDSAVEQRG